MGGWDGVAGTGGWDGWDAFDLRLGKGHPARERERAKHGKTNCNMRKKVLYKEKQEVGFGESLVGCGRQKVFRPLTPLRNRFFLMP